MRNLLLVDNEYSKYMTAAAGGMLNRLHPRLFHVDYIAHLLQNCATTVRANYPAVDELVARVKAVTITNKLIRALLTFIGQPSQPVATRWAVGQKLISIT